MINFFKEIHNYKLEHNRFLTNIKYENFNSLLKSQKIIKRRTIKERTLIEEIFDYKKYFVLTFQT